jgi:hypothetical protein
MFSASGERPPGWMKQSISGRPQQGQLEDLFLLRFEVELAVVQQPVDMDFRCPAC